MVAFTLKRSSHGTSWWCMLSGCRAEEKEKKTFIRTPHKHVAIFISLVDGFSSKRHWNMLTVWSSRCVQQLPSLFVGLWRQYQADGTIFIRKCDISMWNFSFIKRKQKIKRKIDGWVLRSGFSCFFPARCVCVLVTIHVIARTQTRNCSVGTAFVAYCCSFFAADGVYGVQMTRWYSSAVASLACLPMHILNFVQNIWNERLFSHSPKHSGFYLTWGYGEKNAEWKSDSNNNNRNNSKLHVCQTRQ